MKHRRRHVVPIVIAVLLFGIAVFAYIQRSNLNALIMSMRYSEEDLQSLQNQATQELIEKFNLNPEVLEQIDASTPSPADSSADSADAFLPEAIQDQFAEQSNRSTDKDELDSKIELSPDNGKDPVLAETDSFPKDVQKIVYSFYSLQSQYIGRLDGIRAAAVARYKALPESEKGASAKVSIAKSGVSQAMSLESQCDGRVASLLSELRASLRKHSLEESLADSVENYYSTQKGLLKAEYMRKYNKYLK